jgi:hypothetical protein
VKKAAGAIPYPLDAGQSDHFGPRCASSFFSDDQRNVTVTNLTNLNQAT